MSVSESEIGVVVAVALPKSTYAALAGIVNFAVGIQASLCGVAEACMTVNLSKSLPRPGQGSEQASSA